MARQESRQDLSTSQPALRVLFATPECAPWIKTGGLGDVAQTLAAELRRQGIDVRIVMPAYRPLLSRIARLPRCATLNMSALPAASLVETVLPGDLPAWLVECPELFDRAGTPYQDERGRDFDDNATRFAMLSRIAALLATPATPLEWRPAVLHLHDWQTAAGAGIAHFAPGERARTLVTIHNLAFQGNFDGDLTPLLGLPPAAFAIEGVEFYGQTSFLKAGLMFADAISTVSPTYAVEIQHAPLGFGLEGVLAKRRDRLVGILNGIDEAAWDPSRDPLVAQRYDRDTLEAKWANKAALQQSLRLPVRDDVLLLGTVSRLTAQKGSDLVAALASRIAAAPAQLAVLGNGDGSFRRELVAAAAAHPGAIAVRIGFDETFAHRVMAGADALLMPSRFEPCGLTQMYSQRYGTPPIAHSTGGLRDSIVDATPAQLAAGTATGFLFDQPTADALWQAIERAREAWQSTPLWRSIQRAGMAQPFGWSERARDYAALYSGLLGSAFDEGQKRRLDDASA